MPPAHQYASELCLERTRRRRVRCKIEVTRTPRRIDAIRVSDDGLGINALEADRHFGNLGGSWKRDTARTPFSGRVLHGSKGGRLGLQPRQPRRKRRPSRPPTACARSCWAAPRRPQPVHACEAAPGRRPARGHITESATLSLLLDAARTVQQIASNFALYLKAYPNVRIYFQGAGQSVIVNTCRTYHLKSSEGNKAELQVIEWKTKQSRGKGGLLQHRRLSRCTRPTPRCGSGFNYTAYLSRNASPTCMRRTCCSSKNAPGCALF